MRPSPPAKAASSASRHANPTRAIRQLALRGDAYAALEDCRVYRVSTQELVDVTSLWDPDSGRVVLAFARSMG